MSGERKSVLSAPLTARIGKCGGETLRNMVVITVSRNGYAVFFIPEKLGQSVKYISAEAILIRFGNIVRPRNNNVRFIRRIF